MFTQNFCLFCKNSANRKPFLLQTMFFTFQNYSAVIKLQRCRQEHLEAYNLLSGDKILCALPAILRRVILFREHDHEKFLLVIRKNSHVSDANKVAKTKNWWLQNFPCQFLVCQTLVFVLVRTGLSEGDDRMIFWGSEFSIPGLFWLGEFSKYFLGRPDLSMDFLGVFRTHILRMFLRIFYKCCGEIALQYSTS